MKKSSEAGYGFPVGADPCVSPVVDASLVEVFLPHGVPTPDIRSICELRVWGGHTGLWDSPEEGPSLQKTQTLIHRGFSTTPEKGAFLSKGGIRARRRDAPCLTLPPQSGRTFDTSFDRLSAAQDENSGRSSGLTTAVTTIKGEKSPPRVRNSPHFPSPWIRRISV